MSSPYTDEELRRAWTAFADKYPTEKILINTMRSSEPVATAPNAYDVTVETDIQAELMARFLGEITTHCRNSVANSAVTFTIKINEGVPSPHTWNEREVLAHMLQTPSLKNFVNALNLSLV